MVDFRSRASALAGYTLRQCEAPVGLHRKGRLRGTGGHAAAYALYIVSSAVVGTSDFGAFLIGAIARAIPPIHSGILFFLAPHAVPVLGIVAGIFAWRRYDFHTAAFIANAASTVAAVLAIRYGPYDLLRASAFVALANAMYIVICMLFPKMLLGSRKSAGGDCFRLLLLHSLSISYSLSVLHIVDC